MLKHWLPTMQSGHPQLRAHPRIVAHDIAPTPAQRAGRLRCRILCSCFCFSWRHGHGNHNKKGHFTCRGRPMQRASVFRNPWVMTHDPCQPIGRWSPDAGKPATCLKKLPPRRVLPKDSSMLRANSQIHVPNPVLADLSMSCRSV